MSENTHQKVNNTLLGITAILAILLIVLFTVNGSKQGTLRTDTGMAIEIALSEVNSETNVQLCKLIVGTTTAYDGTMLSTILASGASSYYSGFSVAIDAINDDGCVVNINGNSDYIAVGQMQKVGPLYVTVREVLN
jgi:hypothetical protein